MSPGGFTPGSVRLRLPRRVSARVASGAGFSGSVSRRLVSRAARTPQHRAAPCTPLRTRDTPGRRLRNDGDARRAGRTPRRRSCTPARRPAATGERRRGPTGQAGTGSSPRGRTHQRNPCRARCTRACPPRRLPRDPRSRTTCTIGHSSSRRRSPRRPQPTPSGTPVGAASNISRVLVMRLVRRGVHNVAVHLLSPALVKRRRGAAQARQAGSMRPIHRDRPARRRRRAPSSRSAADRRIELELKRRRLERLVRRSRSSALGPVRDHIMGPARAVADAPIERLDR